MSENKSEEQLIRVHAISDEVEQTLIEEVLTANEVPYVVKSFVDGALDGIFKPAYGMAEVLVPQKDAERARTLIVNALQHNPG
jgi:hypothetical protein